MTVVQKSAAMPQETMPKPEHPRPDWQRSQWMNLNGSWDFRFDSDGTGVSEQWQLAEKSAFPQDIIVPFSWASPLSGIHEDRKGAAWYGRSVRYDAVKPGERLLLHFGAVDYSCTVWVNGKEAGSHTGGYGAFAFDVTDAWVPEAENRIVVRAEDHDQTYQTRGKQGYGEIRGIWQTVWLEIRPQTHIESLRFVTKLDGTIEVSGRIRAGRAGEAALDFQFDGGRVQHRTTLVLAEGDQPFQTAFQVASPQLWSPENPYLYEGTITLSCPDTGSAESADVISTYFGIREIGTSLHEDRSYRWITLNGNPVFLNGTLDQAFHPTGFFTYPSDDEMHDEIWRLKRLGLNFVRIHIKPEEPRKLYWADKLGMLVMEDMPCFWGAPDETARSAYEAEAREILERDYNHPSIISWVVFNETWGLFTKLEDSRRYLPETQEWVRSVYKWAKSEDPTRLVEDNSPCNYDHVESDLNTWHFYLNGYQKVRDHVQKVVDQTFPGSEFNYTNGNTQSDAPLMNSECGAVWGIEGSAGDSDLAWHYRYMINEFRRHDKMCGFIFTEFHDVVNEFNGYYRIDGSDKDFGYDAFVPGMSLADLHAPDFIVIDAPPCETMKIGQTAEIPLLRSSYSGRYHGQSLQLDWELWYDSLGRRVTEAHGRVALDWNGYGVSPAGSLSVRMPACDAVAILALTLRDNNGNAVTRNFITFDVRSEQENGQYELDGGWLSIPVKDYSRMEWPNAWLALQGHKVSGGSEGYFEYEVELPKSADGIDHAVGHIELVFEAGAKLILPKDREKATDAAIDLDFMQGMTSDPGMNPSSYFMTDESKHSSIARVWIDGEAVDSIFLPDDPADSRGVLSWHYQAVDNKLEEAGSYGYLHKVAVPSNLVAAARRKGRFTLRLQASGSAPGIEGGGLAMYGRNAGRYPIDLLVRYW